MTKISSHAVNGRTQQERPAVTKACVQKEEVAMTREDVLKLFPDATDAQITGVLNANNSEVKREREKADEYKANAKKYTENAGRYATMEQENADYKRRIEEMEQGNLTEIEKANKALENANNRIAELEKTQFITSQRADAMTNFKITADQAKEVVKDDGSLDMVKIGQIMTEKESAAALAKEQEIANASSNPGGHGGSGGNEGNDIAKQLATQAAQRAKQVDKNILSNYRR